ncbi:BH3-interacting domain death agonist isoform X1 [Rissa tridactyla]|uniref:BH3-interacting domain death agonist isoform X1 n=3 Tax=Rissa tridactyla TaxID=75485 RepID=UPI0023BAAEC7|nr:BH3-interacting domain death agonist isoform X1 [Rissa tridactyla]
MLAHGNGRTCVETKIKRIFLSSRWHNSYCLQSTLEIFWFAVLVRACPSGTCICQRHYCQVGKDFWPEAGGDKSSFVSESIMEQINGSVQMESALLYTFLEVSSDCKFKEQLHSLQNQGTVSFLKGSYCYDDEVELQTDGNRSGHLQNGELVFGPEVNEEVIRIIAAQLAEIGDQFDKEIKARVVNDLVQHFLNENLSGEEITRRMSEAVEGLARAIPSDMEREKAMLVLAMVLTKKIANTMPSLLQRVFRTTVNYISQQLHNYIVRMLRE